MSWSSGTALASAIWDGIEGLGMADADPAKVKALARLIVREFEAMDCDGLDGIGGRLGEEATAMHLERDGAPEQPAKGARFDDGWGETYEFDGTRWVYVDEEE